jgi:hypothetical protein
LRDVQVLFEGQGDEMREQGIVEGGPPTLEVCLSLNGTLLDVRLPEEGGRQRDRGPPVVGANGAARQDADTKKKGEEAGMG